MLMMSQKWNQAKEGVVSFYKKKFATKTFEVEIVYWVRPRLDNSFFHFEKVADIMDERMVGCSMGDQGEFIARYKIEAEERDEATQQAQEICNAITNVLGGNFTFGHFQVK